MALVTRAGLGVNREMDRYMDRDVDDGVRESVGVGGPLLAKIVRPRCGRCSLTFVARRAVGQPPPARAGRRNWMMTGW
jgi:hypothetical protein